MYENMTYEDILQEMLDRVPDTVDKREGSVIYDALAPAAVELQNMYIALDSILDMTFADTARGEYLDKRICELKRKEATCAVVEGVFTPPTIDLIGQRFNCGTYNYIVTSETDTAGTYELTCETSGSTPNGLVGSIIPINYIPGLETAVISRLLIAGEDRETDDSFRERYYDTLDSQAFGGNIADYKMRVNEIDGVGGCKIIPAWDGGGTVKVILIASDYSVPTSTLVDKVQEMIDPIENQGSGLGTAPIGHVVTIDSVSSTSVNISTNITYQSGWNWESASEYIIAAVNQYFLELARSWEDSENIIVRISQIETRILNCSGVLDISNTLLNGVAYNLTLDTYSIPKRGEISDGA